ncbi:MAG: RelA/SpoT family protein [archaeon]
MDDELVAFTDLIKSYDQKANIDLITKAYNFAESAHKGQKRVSGGEFFQHPVEVAKILIEWKLDSASICAALLHDCVEDANVDLQIIKKEFDEEIANLVEGETKLNKIVFSSHEDYTAENIRKVLIASTKDLRVILIKLADRLHNMRTLKHFEEEKQRRISRETMDIYAPIAHKLGMYSLKGELEDLSLRFLEPEVYLDLKRRINEKREIREKRAEGLMEIIREKLRENNIYFTEVSGRAKYFYSVYKKMLQEKKSFDEIYDLIAVRVIVKTIPECYKVLALIHQIWKPIPGRLKDYIAVPKSNGYQSLHTDVVTPYGTILEVQIRTVEMHYIAKYGVAAHWRYKGTERDQEFDKRIAWLEQILDWKRKVPNDFIESLKVDLFQDEIVVFTPKGDPIILPEGSTPIDFAYAVHTWLGDHCVKSEVNKKLVSFDTILKSGDIVNIITSNNASPARNWLGFAKTNRAKQKIRSTLGIEIDIKEGKDSQKEEKVTDIKKYIVHDGKKAPIKISKCCNPTIDDSIVAFRMKDNTITVHKKECPNIYALDSSKKVNVRWNVPDDDSKTLLITTEDKIGLLETILNSMVKEKISVIAINAKLGKQSIQITLKIKAPDKATEELAINILKSINHVKQVELK